MPQGLRYVILILGAEALDPVSIGGGGGRIWLDGVQCTGTERELIDCPASSNGINPCTHDQDARVRCQEGKIQRTLK